MSLASLPMTLVNLLFPLMSIRALTQHSVQFSLTIMLMLEVLSDLLGKLKSVHLERLNHQELRAPPECSSRPISDDPTQPFNVDLYEKKKREDIFVGSFAQQKLLINCQNRKKTRKHIF